MDIDLIDDNGMSVEFSPRASCQLNAAEWKVLDCDNINALRKEAVERGLTISTWYDGKTLEKWLLEQKEYEAIARIKQSQPKKLKTVYDSLESGLINLNHKLDYEYLSKLFSKYGTYGDD
jgi:hypothetical protein